MFDPNLAINAVFDALGRPATVQETIPRAIRVVYRQPDEAERFGSREILSTTVILEVRRADMTGIAAGTRILVGEEMRVVRGTPEYRDGDRLVAVLNTVPETA